AEQFERVTALALLQHMIAGKRILRVVVYGLQCTALAELDIVTKVELQLLEKFQATHREVRFEIGHVSPTDAADGAGVEARGFGGNFASLQNGHVVRSPLGKRPRSRAAGDTAADDEDFGLGHILL